MKLFERLFPGLCKSFRKWEEDQLFLEFNGTFPVEGDDADYQICMEWARMHEADWAMLKSENKYDMSDKEYEIIRKHGKLRIAANGELLVV